MADSGAFGSSLSILFGLWPANFATIFAAMETCFGFGYAVGKVTIRAQLVYVTQPCDVRRMTV